MTNSSGVVIGTDVLPLLPPGQPIPLSPERGARVSGALAIAGLAEQWAATAVQGRAALPAFLLRLASALVTRASIFPSAGTIVGSSDTRLMVFLRCEHETAGLTAWDCACKAVLACLPGDDRWEDFQAAHAAFTRVARALRPDLSTAAIGREARRLDLPWHRMNIPGQHVQIGQGVHRRFLYHGNSDAMGAISRQMSQDKMLTNRLLAAAGVPVLPMAEVSSAASAVKAAERIGYPVVVKPCHGGKGRGVSVHLTDATQVAAAFRRAAADPDSVVVEKFASGYDHRVLVLDGQIISVARRTPAVVTGDGSRTVAALVDLLNQDPRRAHHHDDLLTLVEIDDEILGLLAEQGLTPASIPEPGRRVPLRRTANISTGGMATDATDDIHPDNRAILERAAATMELDIVGIDFLIDDIARSWREIGGVVLELNAFPGFRPHWLAHPARGVEGPILRALLPQGGDGRIPTCAITGSVGKTTTADMAARILGGMGVTVGRCTTAGIWVGGERLRTGDCADGRFARDLLLNRQVEAAIFELACGVLLNHGMTIDDCEVGAVLNVLDHHVGTDGIAGRAELARIKSIVARRARRWLVLNAEDPLCLAMRQAARAERLCLVGAPFRSDALRAHIAAGGCAVTLRPSPEGDEIRLVDRGIAQAVVKAAEITGSLAGRDAGQVWNAMFAAAIAQAMGATVDDIRKGLRSTGTALGDEGSAPA